MPERNVPPCVHALPLLLLLLAGCAPRGSAGAAPPPPTETRVQRGSDVILIRNEGGRVEAEVGAPLLRVWEALGATYEALEIPLETIEPAQGKVASPRFRARRIAGERMSHWVDCGGSMTGPRADSYLVRLTVTTTLRPAGDDATRLLTSVDATARPADVSGNEIHCSSKGTLGEAIAERVRARVG